MGDPHRGQITAEATTPFPQVWQYLATGPGANCGYVGGPIGGGTAEAGANWGGAAGGGAAWYGSEDVERPQVAQKRSLGSVAAPQLEQLTRGLRYIAVVQVVSAKIPWTKLQDQKSKRRPCGDTPAA